ncbi:MAG: hypothetical protein LBL98_07945 [Ruminococcus sp.]|nr:hypothetical protein [Ruminococcus sp.]
MKKEELIKKAARRGIAVTEAQAEKLTALTDEELENIAGGRGMKISTGEKKYTDDRTKISTAEKDNDLCD